MSEPLGWSGVRERVLAVAAAKERSDRAAAESIDWSRDRVWAFTAPPEERLPEPEGAWSPPPALYPVLTAEEIAEAEAQFGVTLPEEYRSFLAEVGAGGDGPELELAELRKVNGSWGWITENDAGCVFMLDASGPFVESEDWGDAQVAVLRAAGIEPGDPDEDGNYLDGYVRAFGESAGWSALYGDQERGAIRLSDNGCAMTGWLIVVGPHRGEVQDHQYTGAPFVPYLDALGNRHTFRSWYLEWLGRREAEYAEHLAL